MSDVWGMAKGPEKGGEVGQQEPTGGVNAAAHPHALFHGKITYISDVLDPATRTMRLRVTAPNPDVRLKPEMFALVRAYAAPDSEVLTVPLAAIQNGSAGKMLFVQRGANEFEPRTVKLGAEHGEVVTVLAGVQAGEPVVTKGSFILKSEMERHKIEPAP